MGAALREFAIGSRGYYRTPLHRQPAMAPYVTDITPLPATEALASTTLALPMSPSLGSAQAQEVAAAVERATAQLSRGP